ncbi:MAG: hypothetical protein AAFP10_00925 [Pseudomonadota bacterium]
MFKKDFINQYETKSNSDTLWDKVTVRVKRLRRILLLRWFIRIE